ncbi:TniB family NTP-binding protein, partial [Sphingomonas sanguinis]
RRTNNFPHRPRPRQRRQASRPPALPQGGLLNTLTLSAGQAEALAGLEGPIAEADRLMRVRPQSLYAAKPLESGGAIVDLVEAVGADRAARIESARRAPTRPDDRSPIAAVLDGYPIDRHDLLANRIAITEVEVPGVAVPVDRRAHGTAMASFIIHGDLDAYEPPLNRTIASVPILGAPQSLSVETTPPDKLPIGMVYRAVLALVADEDGNLRDDSNIVILNHSICDREAPFSRRPSNWAKLLDHLSHQYRLLFVVSAGNVIDTFDLDTYTSCAQFDAAPSNERQIVLLRSVENFKGRRVILSPAEAINAITVGAVHEDRTVGNPQGHLNPYAPIGVPNLGSSVGLFSSILRELGDGFYEKGTEEVLQKRSYLGLRERGVKLLIIDEVQHLQYRSTPRSDVTDTLKRVLDDAICPLVFIGIDDAAPFLNANKQLANRLHPPCDLPPLDIWNETQRATFKAYAHGLDKALVDSGLTTRLSGLAKGNRLTCLMAVSNGVLGRVSNLVRSALAEALSRNAEMIEVCDLSAATQSWAMVQGFIDYDPFVSNVRWADFGPRPN